LAHSFAFVIFVESAPTLQGNDCLVKLSISYKSRG
jgi:hypothetical protein